MTTAVAPQEYKVPDFQLQDCPKDIALGTDMIQGIRVVRVEGDVDIYTVQWIQILLAKQIDKGHHQMVVDLSRVEYISADGLGMLVGLYSRLTKLNGDLCLVLSDKIVRIFEITNLKNLFKVLPTAAEAAEHLLAN